MARLTAINSGFAACLFITVMETYTKLNHMTTYSTLISSGNGNQGAVISISLVLECMASGPYIDHSVAANTAAHKFVAEQCRQSVQKITLVRTTYLHKYSNLRPSLVQTEENSKEISGNSRCGLIA